MSTSSALSNGFSVSVYRHKSVEYTTVLDAPMELGRQDQRRGEPHPYNCTEDRKKLVIANYRELTISRTHALLEPLASGNLRVYNCSKTSVVLIDADRLQPGDTRDVGIPVLLTLGDRVVRIEPVGTPQPFDSPLASLAQPTMAPGQSDVKSARLVDIFSTRDKPEHALQLVSWLQATMGVFHSAATSEDFLPQAVRAVAENVNLDSAAVLTWEENEWKTKEVHVTGEAETYTLWKPSHTLMDRVREEKRTFWQTPSHESSTPESLIGVSAFVASPILNPASEVVGAIYGDRRRVDRFDGNIEITELEAMLVELMACGIAAGLARLEQEQEALAERVRFEQFFTPQLAEQLEVKPDLLVGRDADVTILFCDIRGFSAVTERLGAKRSIEWINDALGCLSQCVIEHQGVLVDYVGDELMAMWGAPEPQEDHAHRACLAAQNMVEQLPKLNERWEAELGSPMGVGVGINSGMAQVGNVGSQWKFKYGALGNVVNLASRTQGATKHVKTSLLITGATAEKLDANFPIRRLCQVRVVNIAEPITLYELAVSPDADWQILKRQYEAALQSFETKDFLSATRVLGNLVEQHPNDGPTTVLLSRTVGLLASPPDDFDPVWELLSK